MGKHVAVEESSDSWAMEVYAETLTRASQGSTWSLRPYSLHGLPWNARNIADRQAWKARG